VGDRSPHHTSAVLSLCPTASLATRSSARSSHSFEPVHARSLPTIALYTSSFYAAWAVRNYLSGNTRERGMVTFGTLAAGAALCNHGHPLWGARVAVLGSALVGGSCALVLQRVALWPSAKLAHVSRKTDVWARVYKAHLASLTLMMGCFAWGFATAV